MMYIKSFLSFAMSRVITTFTCTVLDKVESACPCRLIASFYV